MTVRHRRWSTEADSFVAVRLEDGSVRIDLRPHPETGDAMRSLTLSGATWVRMVASLAAMPENPGILPLVTSLHGGTAVAMVRGVALLDASIVLGRVIRLAVDAALVTIAILAAWRLGLPSTSGMVVGAIVGMEAASVCVNIFNRQVGNRILAGSARQDGDGAP